MLVELEEGAARRRLWSTVCVEKSTVCVEKSTVCVEKSTVCVEKSTICVEKDPRVVFFLEAQVNACIYSRYR